MREGPDGGQEQKHRDQDGQRAPEALSGELVDEAADLYSLATIAYFLLTGVHPYAGRSPRELFQQLLTQDPTPLNEAVRGVRFSSAFERVIMKALSRSPTERQPSVQVFATELRAALERGSDPAGPSDLEPEAAGGGLLGKMKSMFKGKKD